MARSTGNYSPTSLFALAGGRDSLPWLGASVAALSLFFLAHELARGGDFAPGPLSLLEQIACLAALATGGVAMCRFLRGNERERRARAEALQHIQPFATTILENLRGIRRLPAPAPAPSVVRPQAWSLDVLLGLDAGSFAALCLAWYRIKGMHPRSFALGRAGEADLRLHQDAAAPTRCTGIVRCLGGAGPVGALTLSDLLAVKTRGKIDKAFCLAPGGYTHEARAFARVQHLTLIDGPMFLAMLQRLPPEVSRKLLAVSLEGSPAPR